MGSTTQTETGHSSTSGGAADLLDFDNGYEVAEAAVYLEKLRHAISDPSLEVDVKRLRAAVILICAAQIERNGLVDTKSFAWLRENPATHLDTIFPGIRDPTHGPAAFPSSIGRFILLGVVGVGGYATVYSAVDVRYRRMIAIKALQARGGADERPRKLLMHEAEIMKQTNCAHIIRVYNSYEIGRENVIAMEMASGGNLARVLVTHGVFSRHRAAEMARQVTAGIEAAHVLGVIHRDVKPGNVLFDGDARWCISDFGLAKRVDRINSNSSAARMRGTRVYASLEQLEMNDVNEQSDIFAIGMILFEAVTGKRAFDADGIEEQKQLIKNQVGINTRRNRQLLGVELMAIVSKCLQPFPEHRYQHATDLRLDLANYLAGKPISVTPPSAIDEAKRFARQHKAATLAAIAALMVAFLLSLVFVDAMVRRRMSLQLLRQGEIAAVTGDLAEKHVNSRERAIGRLTSIVEKYGASDDLTDPFTAALLKQGTTEAWSVEAEQHLGFDVTIDGAKAAVASPSGGVDIVHRDKDLREHLIDDSEEPVIFLEWSNCGRFLAAMHDLPRDASSDDRRAFRVFDVQKKKCLEEIPIGIHDEAWAFSPSGSMIAVADAGTGMIRQFDLDRHREVSRFEIPIGSWVRAISLMPSDHSIAIAYANTGTVEIRDLSDGVISEQWTVPGDIADLEVSRTGTFAVAAKQNVYLFEPGASQAVGVLHAHGGPLDRVRFSNQGHHLLTHCNRNEMKLWDVEYAVLLMQGSASRHLRFVRGDSEISGAFACDGDGQPGLAISSLEREKYARQLRIEAARGGVRSLVLSDDGSHLFAATDGGTAMVQLNSLALETKLIDQVACADVAVVGSNLFSSRRFRLVLRSIDDLTQDAIASPSSRRLLSYLNQDHHYGSPLAVDSLGQVIAFVQAATGEAIVIEDGKDELRLPAGGFRCLAISPGGRSLIGSRSSGKGLTRIWDLSQPESPQEFEFAASNVQFIGHANRFLLGGSTEYQLRDIADPAFLRTFPRSNQSFDAPIAVCNAASIVAIVRTDNAIDLYDSSSWEKRLTIPCDASRIQKLAFSKCGNKVASLDRDGRIVVFDLGQVAKQCETHGLALPFQMAIDEDQRSVLPEIRYSFASLPAFEWMQGARSIGRDAAPTHREIEKLLVSLEQCDEESLPVQMRSLAHKYLLLGGAHEARRYFERSFRAKAEAECLYFAGVLAMALDDAEGYERLRDQVTDGMIRSDVLGYCAARMCLLRPGVQPRILEATMTTLRERLELNRPPEKEWLSTIMALALLRDDKPTAAATLMKSLTNGRYGQLDLFEKSVAALTLQRDGQEELAAKVISLCENHPNHRMANLRIYSEILLDECRQLIKSNETH